MKSGMSADEVYQVPTQANVTRSLKLARVASRCDHLSQVITRVIDSRQLLARVTRL